MLALGELAVAGRSVNELAPPALAAYRPAWIDSLGSEPQPHRLCVMPIPRAARERLATTPAGWNSEWWWTLGVQDMLAPPIGARWGLDGSYDGDFTGLAPPALSSLTQALVRARGTPVAMRLLQMGGVDHVVSLEDESWLGPPSREVGSVFSVPARIYRVPDPLPRTYAVDGIRVAAEPASFDLLADPGFDPRRELILATGTAQAPRPGFSGTSRLLWRRADALALEAELSLPGHVVVLDGFHPGWRAAVDGVPAELLKANLMFRAVPVPAGRHVVEMRYRPRAALWGGLVSGVALIAGLGLIVREHGYRIARGSSVSAPAP